MSSAPFASLTRPLGDNAMDRRTFTARSIAAGLASMGLGASSLLAEQDEVYDYIVVGTGAGGGPLAVNLARAGYRVLVLEAGDEGDRKDPIYATPAYHPHSSEDPRMSWNFYVRHYSHRPERDPKYVTHEGGVLYPRAATVGGCTAHNAMIAVYPANKDWDYIKGVTGDASWDSASMRQYYERLERCYYHPRPKKPEDQQVARHGYDGWLATTQVPLTFSLGDAKILRMVAAATSLYPPKPLQNNGLPLDPNHWQVVNEKREGVFSAPLSVHNGRRWGTREYLLWARDHLSNKLTLRTRSLVSRVLFDDGKKAIGVEYLEGARLYGASPYVSQSLGIKRTVKARREVILAAGTFNTPQLLQLSGIGDASLLSRHAITPVVDRPGVGANLQDHLEIGVVYRFKSELDPLKGCTFDPSQDPCLAKYLENGKGFYQSNGSIISIITRSRPELAEPDLYIFGLLGDFRGYYPGYAKDLFKNKNTVSWVVLKAFTPNRAGYVKIRSSDPKERPEIHFRYFEEGSDHANEDLAAMEEGIRIVRRLMSSSYISQDVKEEILPGPQVSTSEELRSYIASHTWGHHASSTCKMGPESDPWAVVDSRFRVHGVSGLRVVDASVFPRIPGYFIVLPTYMIAEKATDVIVEDAKAAD